MPSKTANERILKKYGFKIGDIVLPQKQYFRRVHTSEVNWVIKDCDNLRPGWFIGVKTLQNGVKQFDYEYGNSFRQMSVIHAAMILYWPLMCPIYCPLDAIIKTDLQPYPPNGAENDRRMYSEDMKKWYDPSWPRDSKGRFCKWII